MDAPGRRRRAARDPLLDARPHRPAQGVAAPRRQDHGSRPVVVVAHPRLLDRAETAVWEPRRGSQRRIGAVRATAAAARTAPPRATSRERSARSHGDGIVTGTLRELGRGARTAPEPPRSPPIPIAPQHAPEE